MKKTLALIFLPLLAVSANAVTYFDFDVLDGDGLVIESGESYSEWFNISVPEWALGKGYNPLTEMITSARAIFTLGSAGFGFRDYQIDLDGSDFASGSFFVLGLGGTIEGGDVEGSALISLDESGKLLYEVNNTGDGYFSLISAKLFAEAESRPTVPDSGATLALFGAALMGVATLRRRVRA